LIKTNNHIGSSFSDQRVLIELDFMVLRVLDEVKKKLIKTLSDLKNV